MDMLRQLNGAVAYIEANLTGEISFARASAIACVSEDSFLRFFSYMTGMSLQAYIRRRRLTLAAYDLRAGKERIIDIAVKYGYDSADAFSRAFFRQHGVRPSDYRRRGGALRVYPPVSFEITVKGAKEMNYRLIDVQETTVYGVSRGYDRRVCPTREALRHSMWDAEGEDVPGMLCEGGWNTPGSRSYDGVWYGIWRDDRYWIAREAGDVQKEAPEALTIPTGRYAVFATEKGALAWEALPALFSQIFDCWLPDSGFRQRGGDIIEVYHLYTDHDTRKKERYYEIWVPVEQA